jgi:hypothetical protein
MRFSRAVFPALLAVLLCIFAASAALVRSAEARPAAPTASASKVAGTLSARMVIKRFRAVGKRVVGQGVVISTYKDAAGVTSVTRKPFRLAIRERHTRQQQGWSGAQQEPAPLCHVLLLEVGEVDLTLAGLHAILRAFNPEEPIQVRIQADREGGVLGRLFCDLAEGAGALSTTRRAQFAARTLTARTKGSTIMRAKATVYAPDRGASAGAGSGYSAQGGATPNAPQAPMQVAECNVLHLILGPIHLDLLGLVVDVNKVVLDLKGIPGTLLGDIFCQLSNDPRGEASTVAGTVSTRMVVDGFKAVGNRVVGEGTVISKYTDMAGTTSVQRRTFRLTIPKRHAGQQQGWSAVQQEEPLCQILFLEIGEVDLTLAGLHVIAHAFNPDEPIRLRLQARRSGGILGRLFCDLAQGGGVVPTKRKARIGAQALTTRMKGSTIMRFQAVVYAPNRTTNSGAGTMSSTSGGAAPNAPQAPAQVVECHVLHLILGPVHLDLLGLIADLNKIIVDINAVPGTLLGDIFCLLSSDPKPPPPPPAPPPPPPPPTAPAYAR